jgi:hypothetical protein
MQRQDEPFSAETVDEQIEALQEIRHRMARGRVGPPEVRLIDQLRREFGEEGEDERSIDAVWQRLLHLRRPTPPRQLPRFLTKAPGFDVGPGRDGSRSKRPWRVDVHGRAAPAGRPPHAV